MEKTIASLTGLIREKVPNARMAFLGGSMGTANNPVQASDYDIVVMAPEIKAPISYNNLTNPSNGRKVDLIVRDPETLAFEILEAQDCGKGGVLKMIAEGNILFGAPKNTEVLQQEIKKIIRTGPNDISHEDYKWEYYSLRMGFFAESSYSDWGKKYLTRMVLTHDLAKFHLRTKNQWIAQGKILSRQLLMADPEFKKNLEEAYELQSFSSHQKLNEIFDAIPAKPPEFLQNREDILLKKAFEEGHPAYREPFLISYQDNYDLNLLRDGSEQQKEMVFSYLGNKIWNVAGAVDKQRLGRPSNEYFYSLARLVKTVRHSICVLNNQSPTENGCFALVKEFPEFPDLVHTAENGQPERLKDLVENIARYFNPDCDKESLRISPTTFRSDAGDLKKLVL